MTASELTTVLKGIAPVVREFVASSVSALTLRIAAIEERPIVIGRDGRDGERGEKGLDGSPGTNGRDGLDGKDGAPGAHGEPGAVGERGPEGPVGPPGPAGEIGLAGRSVDDAVLTDLQTRLKGLESLPAQLAAVEARLPAADLDADVLAASLTTLLRKELEETLAAAPLRMQKRVIRDRHGKVERVIDEPAPV